MPRTTKKVYSNSGRIAILTHCLADELEHCRENGQSASTWNRYDPSKCVFNYDQKSTETRPDPGAEGLQPHIKMKYEVRAMDD